MYYELFKNEIHRIRLEKEGIPQGLSLDEYSAVIVGGSPFDLSIPEENKSDIQKKIECDFSHLFDVIVKNDFPFLGACSGNGLLGSYLGTSISTQYREPVSCVTLNLTEEGKKDTLLSEFPDQISVLLGHKEACDSIPNGATLLITGTTCPVQMFRIGENVYATQFHPEGDSEGFIMRIHAYKHHGYFQPYEAESLIEANKNKDCLSRIVRKIADFYINVQLINISNFPRIKKGMDIKANSGFIGYTQKTKIILI